MDETLAELIFDVARDALHADGYEGAVFDKIRFSDLSTESKYFYRELAQEAKSGIMSIGWGHDAKRIQPDRNMIDLIDAIKDGTVK